MRCLNQDLYKSAIERHGKDHQKERAVEELLELAAIILRTKRPEREVSKLDMTYEIADVHIILKSLQYIYEISDVEVWSAKLKKEEKLRSYLE